MRGHWRDDNKMFFILELLFCEIGIVSSALSVARWAFPQHFGKYLEGIDFMVAPPRNSLYAALKLSKWDNRR